MSKPACLLCGGKVDCRCPRCGRSICDGCKDDETNLCVECVAFVRPIPEMGDEA